MDIEKYYKKAIKQAMNVKSKKVNDYNSGIVHRENYYILGEWSLINELWKKILRLISLYSSNKKPQNESIKDSLIDIINYAADFYSYIEFMEQNDKKEIKHRRN